MDQPFREGVAVERKDVLGDVAAGFLVDVVNSPKNSSQLFADLLLETLGEVGTHQTDRGVHGMIAGAAVDAEPFDLLLQHPFEQFDLAARMHAEITHQVLLRLAFPIALPAGVNDQDVAVLHLDRRRSRSWPG